MPNVTVTSLKRENDSLKAEIATLGCGLKICSKLSREMMHRNLAMVAKQAAPSQKTKH